MTQSSQSGWTLLQLMLALLILGILIMVAVPRQQNYYDRVKLAQAVKDISVISLALDDIRTDQGVLPNNLVDIGMGGNLDPWGHPYQYVNIRSAKGNGNLRKDRNLVPINTDYDLYSMGPDGASAGPLSAKTSQDDIIRASDGGFIGPVSEF